MPLFLTKEGVYINPSQITSATIQPNPDTGKFQIVFTMTSREMLTSEDFNTENQAKAKLNQVLNVP